MTQHYVPFILYTNACHWKDTVFNVLELCSWNGGHLSIETTHNRITLKSDEKRLFNNNNITNKQHTNYIKCFSAHFAYPFEHHSNDIALLNCTEHSHAYEHFQCQCQVEFIHL